MLPPQDFALDKLEFVELQNQWGLRTRSDFDRLARLAATRDEDRHGVRARGEPCEAEPVAIDQLGRLEWASDAIECNARRRIRNDSARKLECRLCRADTAREASRDNPSHLVQL